MHTSLVLILILGALAASSVNAAPFLYSDPWPAEGPQPDTCTALEGASSIPLTLIDAAPGSRQIKHNVGALANGAHKWQINCANAWGVSATVPFEFAVGAPTAPSGLRLAP